MKNHFIFPYVGNKRDEVKIIFDYILKQIDINKIKTIIEPFCGSCAMSYYLSTLYPGKFKYIINDTDKDLIEMYKMIKNDKFPEFLDKIEKLCFDDENKFITKEKYKEIIKKDNIEEYFIKNKFNGLRIGLYPLNKKFVDWKKKTLNAPIINFIKNENISIENKDAIEIIDKYKNKKNNLFLLDPPYFLTDNSFYSSNINKETSANIYEYLINYIENNKKIDNLFIILEYNWVIKMVFRDIKKYLYKKKYHGLKKKEVIHVINHF